MAQTFVTIGIGDSIASAVLTKTPNALDALRTDFSGATAPASPSPYQRWVDTTTGLLKRYDPGSSAWKTIGPATANASMQHLVSPLSGAAMSATTTFWFPVCTQNSQVVSVTLLGDTASTSDASNYWSFELLNVTATMELFSDSVSTHEPLSGVGGDEFAALTPYTLIADQDQSIAAGDVIKLVVTKTGSATTIAAMHTVQLNVIARG